MHLLLSSVLTKISVGNNTLLVSICKRCGARIYPLSSLKSHLEYHERKLRDFEKRVLGRADRS